MGLMGQRAPAKCSCAILFLDEIVISVIGIPLLTSLVISRRCTMESIAEQLIPFAVRAPSGHNAQPWQVLVNET